MMAECEHGTTDCEICREYNDMGNPVVKYESMTEECVRKATIKELLVVINRKGNKLHAARYAYHKQIKHKYTVLMVMPIEEAREHYRLAMENYDGIIEDAANGHLTEANEADMAKGLDQ